MASATTSGLDISSFLKQYCNTLPRTVQLLVGFCGTSVLDTLEAGQFLEVFKVETQQMILAHDELNRELCVPTRSKTKVELVPRGCENEYSTLEALFRAESPYFRVLEDIPSLNLFAGNTLKIIDRQEYDRNYLMCETFELPVDECQVVRLPLNLVGRFQPLLDLKEYFLEEVLFDHLLPLNIRFVSRSRSSEQSNEQSLTNLGNICLLREFEEDTVFAASFDDEPVLVVFPKSLDVTLNCGFKVSLETSEKIRQCRQLLKANEKSLRRLDRVTSASFYIATSPIRRFAFESLKPPSLSVAGKPKIGSDRPKGANSASECFELPRESMADLDTTMRDRDHGSSALEEEFATENKCFHFPTKRTVNKQMSLENQSITDDSGNDVVFNGGCDNENIHLQPSLGLLEHEDVDEVNSSKTYENTTPPLPPKSRSLSQSMEAKELTQIKLKSPSPPKPAPRRKLKVAMKASECHPSISQAQGPGINRIDCNSNETTEKTPYNFENEEWIPGLPPKPYFLTLGTEYENEEVLDSSAGSLPPPPLPPRRAGAAYQVRDVVRDWRVLEEEFGLYTEAKDDGQTFKQCGKDVEERHSYLEVIPDSGELQPEYQNRREDEENSDEGDHYEEMEEWVKEEHPYAEVESQPGNMPPSDTEGNMQTIEIEEVAPQSPIREKMVPKTKSKNSISQEMKYCSDTRKQQAVINAEIRAGKRQGWISRRREDDFVDFEDIDHFMEMRKRVADLEKQLAMAEKKPDRLMQKSDGVNGKEVESADNPRTTKFVENENVASPSEAASQTRRFHDICPGAPEDQAKSERQLNQEYYSENELKERSPGKKTTSVRESVSSLGSAMYENSHLEEVDVSYTNSPLYDREVSQDTEEYEMMWHSTTYYNVEDGGCDTSDGVRCGRADEPGLLAVNAERQTDQQQSNFGETSDEYESVWTIVEKNGKDEYESDDSQHDYSPPPSHPQLNKTGSAESEQIPGTESSILRKSESRDNSSSSFPTEKCSIQPYTSHEEASHGEECIDSQPPPLPPKKQSYKEIL